MPLLVAFALLLAVEASATDRKTEEIFLVAAAAADVVTTEIMLRQEGTYETNPLGRGPTWQRVAIKTAGVLTVASLARYAEGSGHGKAASILRWGAVSAWFAASSWNVSLTVRF